MIFFLIIDSVLFATDRVLCSTNIASTKGENIADKYHCLNYIKN